MSRLNELAQGDDTMRRHMRDQMRHHRSRPPGRASVRRGRLLAAVMVVVAGLLGACAGSSNNASDNNAKSDRQTSEARSADANSPSPRLDQIQLIGSHNSYHVAPDRRLLDKLIALVDGLPSVKDDLGDPRSLDYTQPTLTEQLDAGIRSFELDIANDPTGGTFAQPKAPGFFGLTDLALPTGLDGPGIKVIHIVDVDVVSNCPTLISCLTEIRTWSDANPDHMPITVQLELKNDGLPKPFDLTAVVPFGGPELDAMDDEIRSVFDGDRIISPDSVRGDAADLRTAAAAGAWPTVAEAAGKVLFFLDNSGASSDAYRADAPSLQGRVAFTSDHEGQPDGAVLVRNNPLDPEIGDLIRAGYLVRTRADAGLVGDAVTRDAALASGAQIVSSDFFTTRARRTDGYEVTFGTDEEVRCNPVTAPKACRI